jgi:hypothetical protein
MPDTFTSVLIGGLAGGVSAVITYFSTRAKLRLDVAAQYDKQLQDSRLAAYIKLWEMLEPLARFGRDKPVTYAVMKDISDKTRTWYFQTGGIYLTRASATPYFKWKGLMQQLLDDPEFVKKPDEAIPEKQLEAIIAARSTLRTNLSDDIGTKRLSRL